MAAGRKVAYNGKDAAFMKEAGVAGGEPGADVVLTEAVIGANIPKDAKIIAVAAYPADLAEDAATYKSLGAGLLGVVFNKVPQQLVDGVRELATAALEKAGVRLLGVLPEDRALLAITVGELADAVKGKILNNADNAAELVENYMLGAMVVDSGLDYFARKDNKAAVIRHDRPDMQLAALETSTRCLVLANGTEPPVYNVMERAESRGIPVISTESGTADIVAAVEAALAAGRLGQAKKVSRLAELVGQHLDVSAAL